MACNTGASVPKTPVRNSDLPTELKATPYAVGSSTASSAVDDLRPWITRDIKNFKICGADQMLLPLLKMCTDSSRSLPPSQKLALLGTCIEAVMHLLNGESGVPRKIKQHLNEFCNVTSELSSYPHFVQAANAALLN
ncbi:hypothetical protein CY34DRAFT_17538 [Suillus luteus UH-Slu-Lm8-n1]|uniref:Uncharacterized protein n=1 Tax=Suillus luteus UH-Slu-Lm8-n1 TaxID=930992 RepID=A0A0D0A973_9AGAM|nr:hypothetical protein CY34DRAFT_17538 [Suillus luteus UH-Slu-Lm8-n1]